MGVALLCKRAEARQKMEQWSAALSDAQDALKWRPTHGKALLHAAVSSRELQRFDQAMDYVHRIIETQPPPQQEARQMLQELSLSKEKHGVLLGSRKTARASPTQQDTGVKDDGQMLKAFDGYGKDRGATAPLPPVSSMLHHRMGFSEEQVQQLDQFFLDARAKKERETASKRMQDVEYERVKQEYKERASAVSEGRLASIGTEMSEGTHKALESAECPRRTATRVEEIQLATADLDEINKLFSVFEPKRLVVEHRDVANRKILLARVSQVENGTIGEAF